MGRLCRSRASHEKLDQIVVSDRGDSGGSITIAITIRVELIPAALSKAHWHTPTHSPSTTSRNNAVHRSAPVNHGACSGFRGASDTVLTRRSSTVTTTRLWRASMAAGLSAPRPISKRCGVIEGQRNGFEDRRSGRSALSSRAADYAMHDTAVRDSHVRGRRRGVVLSGSSSIRVKRRRAQK